MSPQIDAHPARGRTLAIGFGTTVAMWVVAYLSLMQPGLVVGEALFAMTLACLFGGGFVAGRSIHASEKPWIAGIKIGITSATLNLLLIGSLVNSKPDSDKIITWLIWVAGLFAGSMAMATLGGIVGAGSRSPADHQPASQRNWHYLFNCVAATTVGLLLITGGMVTGMKAGLAVPDWPNSFGHNMLLYPLSEMVGGVFYEHAHRLYGMLVGVTAITVAVSMFVFDRRGWLRALAVAYLLMVCVQGYMGGARVFDKNIVLAIVHGVFGQIVFATIVSIAAFTSNTWKSPLPPTIKPSAATDRGFSVALVIVLILQLGLGALYRHLQRDMAKPPEPLHALFTHIGVAMVVTALVIFVAGRAWGVHRDRPVLPTLGHAALMIVGTQLLLGISAMVVVWMSNPASPPPGYEVAVTTAHQITGALLLASSVLLMLWTRRLLAPEAAVVAEPQRAAA